MQQCPSLPLFLFVSLSPYFHLHLYLSICLAPQPFSRHYLRWFTAKAQDKIIDHPTPPVLLPCACSPGMAFSSVPAYSALSPGGHGPFSLRSTTLSLLLSHSLSLSLSLTDPWLNHFRPSETSSLLSDCALFSSRYVHVSPLQLNREAFEGEACGFGCSKSHEPCCTHSGSPEAMYSVCVCVCTYFSVSITG